MNLHTNAKVLRVNLVDYICVQNVSPIGTFNLLLMLVRKFNYMSPHVSMRKYTLFNYQK